MPCEPAPTADADSGPVGTNRPIAVATRPAPPRARARRSPEPAHALWHAAPWLIFAALALAKGVLLASRAVGMLNDDSIIYFKAARAFTQGEWFAGVHYPPLYPLSLTPAFLFDDPVRAAVALSGLYSSALVFPVWLIAREVVGLRHAAVVTALTCLLPFHYVAARSVMSENLYYPLLLFAVYLVFTRRSRHRLARDLATGLLLAALYLTRYLTLALIPVLLAAWWLREYAGSGRLRPDTDRVLRLLSLCGVMVAVFVPWVAVVKANGLAYRMAMGADVADSLGNPAQLTFTRLMLYVGLYAGAWALASAPLLGLVGLATERMRRFGPADPLTRLTAVLYLIAFGLLVPMARHSWMATYNYPEPKTIVVRYGTYLVALLVVVAYSAAVLLPREPGPKRWVVWTLGLGVPAAVLNGAWFLTFASGAIRAPKISAPDGGAGDVYRLLLLGPWVWPLMLVPLGAVAWLVAKRERSTVVAAVLGAALFLSAGTLAYNRRLDGFLTYQLHARRLSAVLDAPAEGPFPQVALSKRTVASSGLLDSNFVRGVRVNLQFLEDQSLAVQMEGGPRLRPTHIVYTAEEATTAPIARYRVRGREFAVVKAR